MARGQGASLDRKKLMGDPIMVTTIVLLITFLTLFILYPLAILLHLIVDAATVILSGLGMPLLAVEGAIAVLAVITALIARAVWKRNAVRTPAAEEAPQGADRQP